MTHTPSAQAFRGYTVSVRMHGHRLIVHIDQDALVKLGALPHDDADQLRTLNRHMPRFHALALQLGARDAGAEVTIRAKDIWWSADEWSEGPGAALACPQPRGSERRLGNHQPEDGDEEEEGRHT